jgi:hypothetical protein
MSNGLNELSILPELTKLDTDDSPLIIVLTKLIKECRIDPKEYNNTPKKIFLVTSVQEVSV